MSDESNTDAETERTQETGTRTSTAATPVERIAELESRCEDLEARWLRAQADYQNTRRRAQQELEGELLRTMQPLLDELLLVGDFLDMALSAPTTTPEARNLAAGVQMTRAKLSQALEAVDVRAIDTSGPFDPTRHEAAETRTTADAEPGSILATLRGGYTWQGRILRPARVVVAASGGAPGEDAGEEA